MKISNVEIRERAEENRKILEGRLNQRQKRCFDYVPKNWKLRYSRAVVGDLSLKQCVKVKCMECVGYIREEVEKCSSPECPLWHHRPYKGEYVDDYCRWGMEE